MNSQLIKLFALLQLGLLDAKDNFLALQDRAKREGGATAVEYGLLVALIAAVIVVTVKTLGGKVDTAFNTVNSNLP